MTGGLILAKGVGGVVEGGSVAGFFSFLEFTSLIIGQDLNFSS
jgi:hypothetical protein